MTRCALSYAGMIALALLVLPREPDPGELRLGQKVWVDDGSCPAGQIKEVAGTRLTPAGVERERRCVPRR
jgi:hypothetical protein